MWGNQGKRPAIDTLIGRNSAITGDVQFSGGLHIDGCIQGNVQSDADARARLSLSQHGRIEGEVRVGDIDLDGTVVGNVHASGRLELGPHARIDGNVYYNILQMASGAAVNGQLLHRPAAGATPALAAPAGSVSEVPEESFETA